jgi:hypothetical protein
MKKVERKESKRGLIAFSRTTGGSLSDGEFYWEQIAKNKFALKGPTLKDQTKDLLTSARDIAKEIIEDAGHDFKEWRKLLRKEVDSSHVAARILGKGADIQLALNEMEKADAIARVKANAYEAVHAALGLAFYMRALNVVENEVAIDSGYKRTEGAGKGGAARSMRDRDIALARKCLTNPNWLNDRAKIIRRVIKEAGLEYDTGRKAIKRGLVALTR